MSTPQETRELMKQLDQKHVLAAVGRIDGGETGGFANSTKYDLMLGGKRYPPKRVIGLALNEMSGQSFDPYDFKGGEASLCFRTLQRLNFEVVDKSGKHYPKTKPKYEFLTREWVIEAIRALGGHATPAQIEAWITPRRSDFNPKNIDPDLQLMTVNHASRGNHSHNEEPRRCDSGYEMDLLYIQDDGSYVFYDPSKHGIWELAKVAGDDKLRPRLVIEAHDAAVLIEARNTAESQHDFDAKDDKDAREKTMRAIVLRQGQPEFRRDLIAAYEGRCAVTGCDVIDALEAAHIVPYKGAHTNVVRNGLLLRADLHTLFDLKLFRIDPISFVLVLSPQLAASNYAELAGVKIRLPKVRALRPDAEALRIHGAASPAGEA